MSRMAARMPSKRNENFFLAGGDIDGPGSGVGVAGVESVILCFFQKVKIKKNDICVLLLAYYYIILIKKPKNKRYNVYTSIAPDWHRRGKNLVISFYPP